MDLPPVEGFDSLLVMVDQGLTKGVILTPCKKTITAEETGRLLLENLYKRFGLPDKIISDRGPQFASKSFVELLKLLGITSALSTAYHPQTIWHYRTDKSRNRSISIDLLHLPPQGMALRNSHHGIHTQQLKTRRPTGNPF